MTAFRPVFFVLGVLITAMGIAMLAPAAMDLLIRYDDWRVFATCAAASTGVGGLMVMASKGGPIALSRREAFLLTGLSWVGLSAVGALPLLFAGLGLSYTDAFFEAISGLTTTGSTVLAELDHMTPGILLWRAILQWVGGIGIIVMAIAMLPYLRVGGMQLFHTESSDRSEKVLPRAAQLAAATGVAYLVLTLACALAYRAAGMSGFEAVSHAMTTVSTGGYSTSDASLGHFRSPAVEWVATVFMALGSLPFVLYIRLARRQADALWTDTQVRRFLTGLVLVALGMTAWRWWTSGAASFADAARMSAFSVVSVVSTTGYATVDYGEWGSFAVAAFFFLTFVGGCTGSTAGGIKVMRFELMAELFRCQLLRLFQPHGVFPASYRGRPLADDVTVSAMSFVFVFVASFLVLSLALSAFGLDFVTAISGAATALANVGPGLGEVIGPSGSFASLPDAAKWLLAAGMLLGRLEFFTVLVVLTPQFWRA